MREDTILHPSTEKETFHKDLYVYEGGTHLKTQLTDNLKCVYSGKQYLKGDKRIMPFNVASILIDIELKKKYDSKPWKEISEEQYMYFLEVLPPNRWNKYPYGSIFALSERTEGEYTLFVVIYNHKYYKAERSLKKTDQELFNNLKEQLKKM